MRTKLSDAVELLGLGLVLVAAAAFDLRLLIGLVGIVLLAIGYLASVEGDDE